VITFAAGAAADAGPAGAGAAGAPDEVPTAGACDTVSPVARSLPPEEPHPCGVVPAVTGTPSHRAGSGPPEPGPGQPSSTWHPGRQVPVPAAPHIVRPDL